MRKPYLDNLKWIVVVLVVIYHVIYMFNGVVTAGIIGPFQSVQYQDAFQYLVYPWFMLVLFIASGMCAWFELECRPVKAFLRGRTRRLLIPSTLGLLVFGWALGYYNMQISGAFENLSAVPKWVLFLIMCVSGTGPLWYIQMLWVFSVALIALRALGLDKLRDFCGRLPAGAWIAMIPLIWGSANVLNTPVIVVYRFGIYGLGFLLGYLYFSHEAVMDAIEKNWLPLCISAAVIGIAFTVLYWGEPYAEHSVLDTFLCNLYAWVGSLAMLAAMKKWGSFQNRFTRWMAAHSWGLYLLHYLPLAATAWYLQQYAAYLPGFFHYALTVISAFAGGFLLYTIFSRIPFLKWCICGIGG